MKLEQQARRISPLREWILLTRQFVLIQLNDPKNLILSLTFPVIAALITVWIAGENMFVHFEGTKSACFVIVSAAIWGGLFNSIQVVVRERENIKRDHAAGLRLRCYTASRAMVQLLLCLIQSVLLTCSFVGVQWKYGNSLPGEGIISSSALWECWVTIALLTFAADAMGLFLSSLVKKPETANVMAPYILIVQLIFSGILFTMQGTADLLSYAMLSRWGMEALGSICDLNQLPLKIQLTISTVPHEAEDMFLRTLPHLSQVWIILLGFSIGFLVLGNLALHRVTKDTR